MGVIVLAQGDVYGVAEGLERIYWNVLALDLVAVFVFVVFALAYVLHRSDWAFLWLVAPWLCAITYTLGWVVEDPGHLSPIIRTGVAWGDRGLDYLHVLVHASFLFVVVSPLIRRGRSRRNLR
jgi:hypothetical protein